MSNLILSRKKGQSVDIGDDVQLTVLMVDKKTVRLGITAPRCVKIIRSELTNTEKKVTPKK